MDYRERNFIKRVGKDVDGYLYEYVILPDETRIYVNPTIFEEYIKTLPGQLWVPEFRNAYDTIQAYRKTDTVEENDNILNDAIKALRCLAATYCPEIIPELVLTGKEETEQTENAAINIENLPKIFANDEARDVFEALVAAGYLNSEWQPTNSAKSKAALAYMAKSISTLLGLENEYDKLFCSFWNIDKRLAPSLYQITPGKDYVTGIDKALTNAVKKNRCLKETAKGKELLRKYKNPTM